MAAGLQASHMIILGVIGLALVALGTALVLLGNHMIKRSRERAAAKLRHPASGLLDHAPADYAEQRRLLDDSLANIEPLRPRRHPATAGPRSFGYGPRR